MGKLEGRNKQINRQVGVEVGSEGEGGNGGATLKAGQPHGTEVRELGRCWVSGQSSRNRSWSILLFLSQGESVYHDKGPVISAMSLDSCQTVRQA